MRHREHLFNIISEFNFLWQDCEVWIFKIISRLYSLKEEENNQVIWRSYCNGFGIVRVVKLYICVIAMLMRSFVLLIWTIITMRKSCSNSIILFMICSWKCFRVVLLYVYVWLCMITDYEELYFLRIINDLQESLTSENKTHVV